MQLYLPDYGPDYKLHLPVSNMENLNTKPYLETIKQQLFTILSQVSPTGAQIQTGQPGTSMTPPDAALPETARERESEMEERDPDTRVGDVGEGRKEHPLEMMPEGDGTRR